MNGVDHTTCFSYKLMFYFLFRFYFLIYWTYNLIYNVCIPIFCVVYRVFIYWSTYLHAEVNDRNATFGLHYGGVLVKGLATEYRDFVYVNIEMEQNRVCWWSFTTDFRGWALKTKMLMVFSLYYRQSAKTLV